MLALLLLLLVGSRSGFLNSTGKTLDPQPTAVHLNRLAALTTALRGLSSTSCSSPVLLMSPMSRPSSVSRQRRWMRWRQGRIAVS